MFLFITKFLQPIAFLIYLTGFFIYCRQQQARHVRVLYTYYVLATALHIFIGVDSVLGLVLKSNIWLYEVLGLLSILFISYYFYQLLTSTLKKKLVLLLLLVYLVYTITRQFTINGQRLFDSVGYSFLSASVATYVFMYFHQVLKNVTEVSILKDFNFWLSSSYLLYFVGSFIIFVNYYSLTNKIINTYTHEERLLLTSLWGLHNVLLFVGALSLLTGSLWITYRRKLA